VAQAKSELRRRLAERRRALSAAQARAAAEACAEHLLAEAGIRAARRVALYAALPDELPTRPLFEVLAELGIARLLPRQRADGGLSFARVERWEDLVPGRHGVPEPPPSAAPVRLGPGDWILVPGLAFDAAGWRLGRGGGVYDRALARLTGPRCAGLGYAFQLVERVPRDSHDRPVDAIVTERGWSWARREGA
jgi:5-formyltetrahydrofolate cyclo-ligase